MSMAWLFDDTIQPKWASAMEARINNRLGLMMATLNEILDGFRTWGTSWKDRALAAEAGLVSAQAALAQTAADLATFQANDAATDASQIQAQADADAAAAQAVLDAVQAADMPPEPPVESPTP